MATLTFAGAAGSVTGSRHLLNLTGGKMLLDCGLFQGHRRDADSKNRTFLFTPADLTAVLLSHAHLDHTGNLPRLVKQGFAGKIYCTRATAELAEVLLQDSANIQQKDAEFYNRKHPAGPIEPLYTADDIAPVIARFCPVEYEDRFEPAPGASARFIEAGHILGSAQIELDWQENGSAHRLVFTGDLGRKNMPLVRDPAQPHAADTVIMESTYGNRLHAAGGNASAHLETVIRRTVKRGGKVFIPAFALGRVQEIASLLETLHNRDSIGRVPVYVDSPLAEKTTAVFSKNRRILDQDFGRQSGQSDPFGAGWVQYISRQADSVKLNALDTPAVIIAPSGMCEGGRILHHLRHNLSDPKNSVVLVGYQAEGTLGRRLSEGKREVLVFGLPVKVRAEIVTAHEYSAHADYKDLTQYLKAFALPPRKVFLVHGEADSARPLAARLGRAGCAEHIHVAAYGETVTI
ncbi:MAG: MBL fold metallo-hydrolase [Elusimicrobiaceae bacterium]|nr:MBL fold metallo-hydrolase [Elusimicrobiaceae bacterium]